MRADNPSVVVIVHFQGMTHGSASCDGESGRDTRLTGGTRLAREAASACKRRRIESSISIALRITHLPRH